MTSTEDPGIRRLNGLRLSAVLLVSYVLRVALAIGGGQQFWADESRYASSRLAAKALLHGEWKESLIQLFGHADHVLFRLFCLPPAVVEALAGKAMPVLVSCYIALFSVAAIYMCWAVARRAGASGREALWAAYLAAASNCLFYYSRHFLPYDISLFIMLCGLWLALGKYSGANSLWVGLVVGVGFLTYNGYWLLGGAILSLHALFGEGQGRFLRRTLFSAAGLLLTIGIVIGIGVLSSKGLIAEYESFSGTVKQGDFHVGYRVIPEFLWYSERGLLLVWAALIACALIPSANPDEARRVRIWGTGALLIVAGLIFFSDLVPHFMVYGRLTRTVVPFACLFAGVGVERIVRTWGSLGGKTVTALAVVVAFIAAYNFAEPLSQTFPDRFQERAEKVIASQRQQGLGFFRMVYAGTLWGRRLDESLPPHEELMRGLHPMQFRPFQYEGYSLEQRRDLNSNDVSMQVVETPFDGSLKVKNLEGYPGPFRIKILMQPDRWGETVPILASGVAGSRDLFFLTYVDPNHISVGLDHWGTGETVSAPIEVDYTVPHELIFSGGNLLPPAGSPLYDRSPELSGLRDRFVAMIDGATVISKQSPFYPSTPDTIYPGQNALGASTSEPILAASVLEFASAPLSLVASAVPSMAAFQLAGSRPAEWQDALGPIRIDFVMSPPKPPVSSEPLISFNGPGSKDVIFVRREGPKQIRIGFDRMGAGALISEPVELPADGRGEMDVSLGSILPDATSKVYSEYPAFGRLRRQVYIRLNSCPVIEASVPFVRIKPADVTIGTNTVGSSTYSENFKGTISFFGTIGPENIPGVGTRLVDLLNNTDRSWSGFTGPFRMRVIFPTSAPGKVEPLLVTGVDGTAEALFVEYGENNSVQFGFSRSNTPPILSRPVAIQPGVAQDLLLSLGTLMPHEDSAIYPNALQLDALRSFAHVGLNGVPLLHEYSAPADNSKDAAWVGSDPLPHPISGTRFEGKIESITLTQPMDIFSEGCLGSSFGRQGWAGYPGPLEVRMRFPQDGPGYGEPIVTSGLRGIGDVLFLRYEANGMARIGEDHWGSSLLLSEPFAFDTSKVHTLIVSMGALFPGDSDSPKSERPQIAKLRGRTVVILDGRLVLSAAEASHPTTPDHIMVGANVIGGTTARSIFSGDIEDIRPADLGQVMR